MGCCCKNVLYSIIEMSALLPLEALSINLNAEYGMCGRKFNKTPNVYQADNYTSALFLVYTQNETLPNRVPNYRNHFTLFSNGHSIIVARSETTLVHCDNDAVIDYDIITPSGTASDRYRSKYKSWQVSFDKNITYTNKPPNTFLDYTLLCSGEFWYFDRGIILNGVSSYNSITDTATSLENQQLGCYSTLIYYEMHVAHTIHQQYSPAAIFQPPLQILAAPTPPIPPTPQQPNPNQNAQQQQQQQQQIQPPLQVRVAPYGNCASLNSNILPHLNAVARPTIQQNDNVQVPEMRANVVMPSLHWFEERQQELRRSNIEYFRPHDYKRPPRWKY